jgi:hypothetical protein
MKEKLSNYFLQIDIFGTHPRFTINGQKKFNTYFGCFITIICVSTIFYFFLIYTKDVIQHENPKVLTTTYNDIQMGKQLITENDFEIAISLQHQNYTNFVNEKIYSLQAGLNTYVNINGKKNHFFKELEVIKCSKYNFKLIPEYFDKLDIENLYCLKNGTFEIEGEFQSDYFKYLYFTFSICKNSTKNNNTCEPEEKIKSILSGGYIGVFMSDKSVNPNQFSSPYQIYGKNIFTTFSYKQYADFWIYFKQLEVQTDTGYFFKSYNKNSFFSFEKYQNNIDYRENDVFAFVGLRQSFTREIYQRSYTKFQEAAANAGGIVKIITLFGELIVYYFRQILYRNFVIQFFKFNKNSIQQNIKCNSSFNMSQKLLLSPIKSNLHRKKKKIKNPISTPKFQLQNQIQVKKNNEINNKNNIYNNSNNSNCNIYNINQNIHTFQQHQNFSSFLKTTLNNNKDFNSKNDSSISVISAINNLINTNKFKTGIIRVESSRNCFKILFKKYCCQKIKRININYNKIEFLFDIVEYFKTIFEVKLMKNKLFNENQREKLSQIFKFDYDFDAEKEGYDIFYKKKTPEYSSFSNKIKNKLY